jgi:hypothetical protein
MVQNCFLNKRFLFLNGTGFLFLSANRRKRRRRARPSELSCSLFEKLFTSNCSYSSSLYESRLTFSKKQTKQDPPWKEKNKPTPYLCLVRICLLLSMIRRLNMKRDRFLSFNFEMFCSRETDSWTVESLKFHDGSIWMHLLPFLVLDEFVVRWDWWRSRTKRTTACLLNRLSFEIRIWTAPWKKVSDSNVYGLVTDLKQRTSEFRLNHNCLCHFDSKPWILLRIRKILTVLVWRKQLRFDSVTDRWSS